MSQSKQSSSLSPNGEERRPAPKNLLSEDDRRAFRSLYGFIEQEKKYLQCPEEGPDELRYIVYRSAFNKVIGRATAYKRLLMAIKAEYDNTIRELKRREDEVRASQRTAAASVSLKDSLMTCQKRAKVLRDRSSALQTETAEVQEQIRRQKSWKQQSSWIPGLTVAEAEDPGALDRHLEDLEAQRAALLDRKRRCVPLEVQAELDAELVAAKRHRDRLRAQNHHLKLLYQRLKLVWDRLSGWEEGGQQAPLEDLLGSSVEGVRQAPSSEGNTSHFKEDARRSDSELFEDEEPTAVDESELLEDHLSRFLELFASARFEEAALHAARSPRGVLRNLDTMQMFTGVAGPPGSVPPPLLFFRALLVTVAAGDELSAPVSLHGVRWALQQSNTQLVTHAVTQNKLTFTEELGDALTEHAQNNPTVADVCLALAAVVYQACGIDRKTALSMCRRGLIHSAAEFMKQCEDVTADDCMWVLRCSPSPQLLQLLTDPPAILSVGVACAALLADPQRQHLALQLLDSFASRGTGLEDVILEDGGSSVDVWTDVASLCSGLKREDLSRTVRSVLLNQSGTGVRSPDLDGGRLMEHVFL
ncbi:clathrin heavy chain linker domain-containing protein 1-like [Odontesthes bonariensis]|uniref:clathrin heavy chain linker domain-containing protein 1-like n=1 Tax=Odontesthes bonariensis TaxID=219752 RepID=UPI003F584FF9